MSTLRTQRAPQAVHDTRIKLRCAPSPLQPQPDPWEQLGAADRDLLRTLLDRPIKCIDEPLFCARGAERTLFGGRPLLDGNSTTSRGLALPGHAVQMLSSSDEILLFRQFNYCRKRQQQIRASLKANTPLAKLRLLLAWAHRGMDVRSRIVEANMPLVLAMFKRAHFFSVDGSEMISEGNLALLRCVSEFDCSRGFKFSTYACRSILKSFARAGVKASRYRSRFPVGFRPQKEPSDYEDRKRDDVNSACTEELRKIVLDNRAGLSETEQVVIRSRFMLGVNPDVGSPQTLHQVGLQIGVTKERVRQIQLRALRKLREALESSFFGHPVSLADLTLVLADRIRVVGSS